MIDIRLTSDVKLINAINTRNNVDLLSYIEPNNAVEMGKSIEVIDASEHTY